MKYSGKVWKFGANVDTDQIIPSQYLVLPDLQEMAKHALEPLKSDFAEKYQAGEIVVAGDNFGCGSSREQAVQVLKELGVKVIIAPSFARIFFRNSINLGVLVLEIKDADHFRQDDKIEVDLASSLVRNLTQGREYKIPPLSEFLREILSCGGLVEYLKAKGRV